MLLVTFLLNQGRFSGFVKFLAWEAPMLTTAHLIAMALRRGLTLRRGREEAATTRRRRCGACSSRTLAAIAWKADRVLLLSGARIGSPPCSRGHGLKTDARPSHEPPLPYTPLSTPPGHHQSPTTNKQPPTTNHQPPIVGVVVAAVWRMGVLGPHALGPTRAPTGPPEATRSL